MLEPEQDGLESEGVFKVTFSVGDGKVKREKKKYQSARVVFKCLAEKQVFDARLKMALGAPTSLMEVLGFENPAALSVPASCGSL